MIFLAGVIAALAAVAVYRCIRMYIASPTFPHDACRDCRMAPEDTRRPARTDEQIDRMARKIHARMMREHA